MGDEILATHHPPTEGSSSAMTQHEGGCLCGQVRYVLKGEPAGVGLCHCTHCQKLSGSAFSMAAIARKEAVEIRGELRTYEDTGDSGEVVFRRFCPACGSQIISEAAIIPEITVIKAGTFDDTRWLQPTFNGFCDSAQGWVEMPRSMQNFHRLPE
jgi:hypothetical protein